MNILLVAGPGISLAEPFNSGIEAFIVAFANQLIEDGHTVDVVAAGGHRDARFGIINPFKASNSDSSSFFLRLLEKIQFRFMDVSRYDIIHYNMFYPHLLNLGSKFNKPSVMTLHSPTDEKRVSVYKKLANKGGLQFVAISERIKSQWEKALDRPLPLISNGINMACWPCKTTSDGAYLLWSGRINTQKNVAAAISLAKKLQLTLMIAGRLADEDYFNREVGPHLGAQIQYLGHLQQSELSALAQNAIAFLATATWQEPFGLAALEMLASGVPVIGFSSALPTDWSSESVLTALSHRWMDLEGFVDKCKFISPQTCRAFASTMSVKKMSAAYVRLYSEKAFKNNT
ncbi:glycosyltransferase [Pedobacter aquatilis]|uniref:glycosyltransferase n=1 Tax=Pedobacter aquatilis TaxID=351343 RepID=UPI00293012FA|nr:glycosyltransferase [Pedobacter aquatilis]